MAEDENGPHFLIRDRKKTVEIPLPLEIGGDTLRMMDWNSSGTALFHQTGIYTAYRYRHGKFANFTNFLPYKYFNAVAINNREHIVGGAQRAFGYVTAFSFYRGYHRELGTLVPDTHAYAVAVNNHGVIVGAAQYHTNQTDFYPYTLHAVIFKRNSIQDIGVFEGAFASQAIGVNDRGVILGYCLIRIPVQDGERILQRGFVYQNGVMSPLRPLPGHFETRPISIDKHGRVVGYSVDEDRETTAVLFIDGEAFDLNDLLPSEEYSRIVRDPALSMNEQGVIAVENDVGEVYLMTPE